MLKEVKEGTMTFLMKQTIHKEIQAMKRTQRIIWS